jgi:hypothetical protein
VKKILVALVIGLFTLSIGCSGDKTKTDGKTKSEEKTKTEK